VQANVESGCCVSNELNMYHRRCICDESGLLTPTQCQSLCSNDPGCKGYVMLERNAGDPCQLATTSSCPSVCRGPYYEENIGPIDSNANCDGSLDDWNGGCLIKTGILLHYSIIITLINLKIN